MKPVSIDFRKVTTGKTVAAGTVSFDNGFVIDGFKIIDGAKGKWVSWPAVKTNDNENPYRPTVGCDDKDLFWAINNAVLELYKKAESSGELKPPIEKNFGGGGWKNKQGGQSPTREKTETAAKRDTSGDEPF